MYPRLGTELFPETDAGTFTINFRAPAGTRIELTTDMARQIEAIVRKVIPPEDLDMVVSNIGIAPSISAIYSPNAAEDSGFIQVELKSGHQHPTKYYVAQLKRLLPMQLSDVRTLFSSGSIIDSVLNLGMQAPIDVQFAGNSFSELNKAAKELQDKINRSAAGVSDFHSPGTGLSDAKRSGRPRESGAPGCQATGSHTERHHGTRFELVYQAVDLDRSRKQGRLFSHGSVSWLRQGLRFCTSSAEHSDRDFDRENGHAQSLLLRDVATISPELHPSEADHYSFQRVVDLLVAPSTEDLGGTQERIQREVSKMTLPPGVSVKYRGAVASMQKSFSSFGFGLSLAVILLYLVMVAQFRSFLDPLIIMFAVPMGLIGVIWTLWLTGTTLNIESFMGIIVMVGIVVSNSILLVDFANERRRQGQELRQAAVESARIRMRPILMTALATVAGLMPIAMKLGEGSEASAPLARAAVGGLSFPPR